MERMMIFYHVLMAAAADRCLPPTCSFSAALKDCQKRKQQTGVDSDRASSSVTFPHYEDLVTQISTPRRLKERKQRPASMDLIASADHIICRDGDGYNYSDTVTSNAMSESHGDKPHCYVKEDTQNKACDCHSHRLASSNFRSFPAPPSPWREGISTANSWSYERVSMAANAYRNRPLAARQNMSGKNLPSKWDDAEKWLCSAASGDSPSNAVYHCRRKPKSKSGPLVVMGTASPVRPLYYSKTKTSSAQGFYHSSPHIANTKKENRVIQGSKPAVLDNIQTQNPSENSSPDTDLAKPEIGGRPSIALCATVDGRSLQIETVREPARNEIYIPELCEQNVDIQNILNRSQYTGEVLSVPIFSDIPTQDKYADTVLETPKLYGSTSSFNAEVVMVQTTNHGNLSSMKDAATEISPTVSRRDMATQITPLGSSRTSRCTTPMKSNSPARHNTPARRSNSESNSTMDVLELLALTKLDIGDSLNEPKVFIPGKSAISSWSSKEKQEEESSKCYFDVVGEWKKKMMEGSAAVWEEAERSKCLARYTREAAKITAWENRQRAKAEAELRKLEMKLEKIRSLSTERIMKKLDSCHKKAEDMRVSLAAEETQHLAKTASLRNKSDHVATLGACFFMKPT